MKHSFYPKLAWTGIRKNKRLYTPYILTCMGMVMMFYIMSFLTSSALLTSMPGGDIMQGMLGLGVRVIGVFALIFLFYTNSFLTRRRKKEFGLYNILSYWKKVRFANFGRTFGSSNQVRLSADFPVGQRGRGVERLSLLP